MKSALTILASATALALVSPALAQAPSASPLLGKWAVDVSKLPIPPEARPKSVTFTVSDAGGGKWSTHVDIVAADGSASHGVAIYTPDGKPAPVTGSPEADTVSVMIPAADVLVMVLSKGGVPGSTRIYTVSADGKSQTETATYFDQKGKPVMRTNHFNRIQ